MGAAEIRTGFEGGTGPLCGPRLLDDALRRLIAPDHGWTPSPCTIPIRVSAFHV